MCFRALGRPTPNQTICPSSGEAVLREAQKLFMSETLDYLKTFARFPFALRRFLRHTLTLDEARRIVREQMARREENFLRVVERNVYGYPRSPYLPLLKLARCELGDLRTLVGQKGVEGALHSLRDAGVYITFEEFKGRRPIVRSGQTFAVTARDFDNPWARRDMTSRTGGSTGPAMAVSQDLDYVAARAPHRMLGLSAHGALGVPCALWGRPLPGSALRGILQRSYFGLTPERWFSPNAWRDSEYWLKYSIATVYMIACMRLSGLRVPWPEVVKPDQELVISRWIHETLKSHPGCLFYTSPSRALRVCLAAEQAGLDLTGTTITVGGEAATPAKIAAMRRVGVRCAPGYTMSEAGQIAFACAQPIDVSDVHLFKDAVALITHPHTLEKQEITVPAFVLTSLLDTAPKVLLNVQMDDYGIVEERHCGCELESYGYTTHLREIHSYSKLVSEGATLIGNEMLRILEEVLPARFGGSPLDYQLLEQEDAQGFTRLFLVISPRVNIADERQAIQVVLETLRESSPMADAARAVWQNAGTLQVKRREPVLTPGGKFLPLHIQRAEIDS